MSETTILGRTDISLQLASAASQVSFADISPEVRRLARHCMLDWLAVTLAGAAEPAAVAIRELLADEGGAPSCTVVGAPLRLPATAAALVNGTASHALDYDDVNLAMPGHPSVAIIPGLLALAESTSCTGAEFLTAFVAGYDLTCQLGVLMSPGHYAAGFHPTGTLGAFGAAAACARLLGLDTHRMQHALGIAGTQAAGLKAMFGNMCKPLHAGRASANGLLAARLAARGFVARTDLIECPQGFAATHSADFHGDCVVARESGHWLHSNLFKYHAACYLTHAPMEAIGAMRCSQGLRPEQVKHVDVTVDRACETVCHILEPQTGLEGKFSLRLTSAMALRGDATSRLDAFTDQAVRDGSLIALRDRVRVHFTSGGPISAAQVLVQRHDGTRLEQYYDSGKPAHDLDEQERRLEAKCLALTEPVIGDVRARELVRQVQRLEELPAIAALAQCAAG